MLQVPKRFASRFLTLTYLLPPGPGRMCTVYFGVGASAFTRMPGQLVQECHTMEKCLSVWPGPRAVWPLSIGNANMSSSWGRNMGCSQVGMERVRNKQGGWIISKVHREGSSLERAYERSCRAVLGYICRWKTVEIQILNHSKNKGTKTKTETLSCMEM